MATARKHMERSHRSYHTTQRSLFMDFERKANYKKGEKVQRKSILEAIKAFFHRTTQK